MKSAKSAAAAPKPMAMTFTHFYTVVYPCSSAHAQRLAQSGELPTFLDGSKRMLLVSVAKSFVRRKAAAGGAVDASTSKRKSEAGKKGRAIQLAAAANSPLDDAVA